VDALHRLAPDLGRQAAAGDADVSGVLSSLPIQTPAT
jgi:hypothetical protein